MEDSLLQLINDPEKLRSIPKQELDDWADKYPYSVHLRLLKAFHHMLHNGLLDKDQLRELALFFPDQSKMAVLLEQYENYIKSSTVQVEPTNDLAISSDEEKTQIETKKKKIKEGKRLRKLIKEKRHDSPIPDHSLELSEAKEAVMSSDAHEFDDMMFLSWLKEITAETQTEVISHNGPSKQTADNSLHENEQLVSVELAELLEKQGHHEQALHMFEKLILTNPEKSAFFAQKISNLKEKIG